MKMKLQSCTLEYTQITTEQEHPNKWWENYMSTHINSRLVPHQSETKHETKGKQVVNVRTCVQVKEYVKTSSLTFHSVVL